MYVPGTGTPPGYRWITIREDAKSPLEYRHILVTESGRVASGPRALMGAPLHVIAPRTAARHKVDVENLRGNAAYHAELRRIAQVRQEMLESARDMGKAYYKDEALGPSLMTRIIRDHGKVRATKDYPDRGDIPLAMLSKHGERLDAVAEAAGFDGDGAMLEAIRADLRRRRDLKRGGEKKAITDTITQMKRSDDWKTLDYLEKMVRAELPKVSRVRKQKKRRRSA